MGTATTIESRRGARILLTYLTSKHAIHIRLVLYKYRMVKVRDVHTTMQKMATEMHKVRCCIIFFYQNIVAQKSIFMICVQDLWLVREWQCTDIWIYIYIYICASRLFLVFFSAIFLCLLSFNSVTKLYGWLFRAWMLRSLNI